MLPRTCEVSITNQMSRLARCVSCRSRDWWAHPLFFIVFCRDDDSMPYNPAQSRPNPTSCQLVKTVRTTTSNTTSWVTSPFVLFINDELRGGALLVRWCHYTPMVRRDPHSRVSYQSLDCGLATQGVMWKTASCALQWWFLSVSGRRIGLGDESFVASRLRLA